MARASAQSPPRRCPWFDQLDEDAAYAPIAAIQLRTLELLVLTHLYSEPLRRSAYQCMVVYRNEEFTHRLTHRGARRLVSLHLAHGQLLRHSRRSFLVAPSREAVILRPGGRSYCIGHDNIRTHTATRKYSHHSIFVHLTVSDRSTRVRLATAADTHRAYSAYRGYPEKVLLLGDFYIFTFR